VTVSNVIIETGTPAISGSLMKEISEGDDIRIAGDSSAHYVTKITYDYDDGNN
jgi:hypothetical protein